MNKYIGGIIAFTAGVGTGSVLTWLLLKTKYEINSAEKCESFEEILARRNNEPNEDVNEEEPLEDAPVDDAAERAKVANAMKGKPKANVEYDKFYVHEEEVKKSTKNRTAKKKKEEEVLLDDGPLEEVLSPYVILPEEFGECDDTSYTCSSLRYHADGVLAYDNGDIVTDLEDIIGFDALSHFGEYEEDSVFVRNPRLKMDYEILLDLTNYYEPVNEPVAPKKPRATSSKKAKV